MLILAMVASHVLIYRLATQERRRVVLVVNGQELSRERLDQTLVQYRDQALTDLGTQVVIEQQARRKQLAVDDEDLPVPQKMDAELRLATLARVRTEALLRKLVLSHYKPKDREDLYQTFREELTGYRLGYILLLDNVDYAALEVDVKSGLAFDKVRRKHGRFNPPEITPELLKPLRPERLFELFGRRGSALVMAMKVGQVSPPLRTELGTLVVRLEAKEDTYEQLLPAIDQILFDSRKNAFLQELAESTSISSPLTWSATEREPINVYGEKAEGLTPPKATATAAPASLPNLKTATPTPAATATPEPGEPPDEATPGPGPIKTPTPPPLKIKTHSPEFVKGPLTAKMLTVTHRLLPARWEGHSVLRVDENDNHHADSFEPMLVKITPDGWQTVDRLEESVNRFSLEKDMGFWVDQPKTHLEGPLWQRKKVVDQPADGRLQPEEVNLKVFRHNPRLFGGNIFELGAEIARDDQGRLTLYEQSADFGRREIERKDVERLKIYRDSDANWEVRAELL